MERKYTLLPVNEIPRSSWGRRKQEYREMLNEAIRLNTKYTQVIVDGEPIKVGSLGTALREQVREMGIGEHVRIITRDTKEESGVYILNAKARVA